MQTSSNNQSQTKETKLTEITVNITIPVPVKTFLQKYLDLAEIPMDQWLQDRIIQAIESLSNGSNNIEDSIRHKIEQLALTL